MGNITVKSSECLFCLFFFFSPKLKIRGLFPYSDSKLNLAHAARGILSSITAELKHSSFWGTDA